MPWTPPQCSVCCSNTFTHKAHIKARRSFEDGENHLIFNILPVCPRCHHIFDTPKGFTLHHEWGCWIFSDLKTLGSSQDNRFPNPFYRFMYAYPPPIHRGKVSRIDVESIIENQQQEFVTRDGIPAPQFFQRLESILRGKGLWDEGKGAPKLRMIKQTLEVEDE